MARVPPSGTLFDTPMNGIPNLKNAISCISQAVPLGDFAEKELIGILGSLSHIIGQGIQSTVAGSVDSKILQCTLQKASESCGFLLDLINVEGFQSIPPDKLEARGRVFEWLRMNPEVSHSAEFSIHIEAIMGGIGQLKSASDMAGYELSKTKFPSGRPKSTWYIDFTALLISICESRNVNPSLSRHSKTGKPSGKLFIFATAMEELLPKELQSYSDEARFDKLKVAKKAFPKKRENLS